LISEGDRPRRRSKEAQARMRELMGETKIGALLQFPTMRLRASELAAMTPGAILRLPLARYAASELRVGGLSFGRAHPVRTGEHRGAQLEGVHRNEFSNVALDSHAASGTMSVN
jgi:flagellar motor switch protein FliM